MSQKELSGKFQELGDKIVSLLGKDKKRNKTSRTETYRSQRIAEATELWTEYNKVLKSLQQISEPDDVCINDAAAQYQKAYKEYTDRLLAIATDPKKDDPTDDEDDEGAMVISLQDKRFTSLKRMIGEIELKQNQQETPSAAYSVIKSQKIIELWKKIEKDDESLDESVYGFRQYQEQFARVEQLVDNALIFLQEHATTTSNNNYNEGLKLNRVEIEKFSGDYFKWTTFKDLFSTMVINNNKLGKAQKMQFLKTHVTGDVADMIRDLTVSEANFDSAWGRLMARYNNERVIIYKMVNKLLTQPNCKGDSKSLKRILDTTDQIILALSNLNRPTEFWNDWIIVIIGQKLDEETQKDWEKKIAKTTTVPTWAELKEFLEEQFRLMERLESSARRQERPSNTKPLKTFQASMEGNCVICKESHKLFSCPKWKEMEPKERLAVVKKQKWCKKCLRSHEDKQTCDRTCKKCGKGHSTWLHENRDETKALTVAHGSFTSSPYQVLLSTALIKIHDNNGNPRYLRVLIDSGSEGSLITQAAASYLNRKTTKSDRWVQGLNDQKSEPLKKVQLTIEPRFNSNFTLKLDFYILKTLTTMLPGHDLDPSSWKHIKQLVWADPKFFKRGKIDALLGMDAIVEIMSPGIIRGLKGQPMAQETQLGWIMSGKIDPSYPANEIKCFVSTTDINQGLEKFWEMEELFPERAPTTEDLACEKFYADTVRKNNKGKFIVKIPFKQDPMGPERLGESKGQAIARFLQIEKRLARDNYLATEYKKAIHSYLDMGHMKDVTDLPKEYKRYYIPHHAVVKPDHLTTKVRVVFDASAKTTTGWSLNECMYVGERQQRDLSDILINWRLFRIVYKADIEKMYRMIELDEDDQKFHTIVWRDAPTEPLREYQLTTTTFGTAAAPFLATRTLVQIANEQQDTYPLASLALTNHFYVDDLLGGSHNLKEAVQCKDELLTALNRHHLPLRKWVSNCTEFLETLPLELTEKMLKQTIFEDEPSKALGLLWSPQTDTFSYKINWLDTDKTTWTKRQFLSETSKLFDPLGWLAPTTINAKLLMQEVWTLTKDGCKWDDEIPTSVAARWVQFRKEFKELEKINFKRWINFVPSCNISLHGFSDASEKAYSAVIYARVAVNDVVTTTLISSKTRVAPIKSKLTIPQLELCGAELVASLMKVVIKSFSFENPEVFMWTDSMITLGWIRSEPSRWKTFVANRVAKIQAHHNYKWDYVPTDQNPADCASRGIMPVELINHSIWWTGPAWLSKPNENWPTAEVQDHDLEQRKAITVNVAQLQHQNDFIENVSSWFKLRRLTAYCRRFLHKQVGPLTVTEIQMAELGLIKQCQQEHFAPEIRDLLAGKPVHNKSKVKSLNVFLDQHELMRVGGRLSNAQIPYDAKHPIILPSGSHLTKIIIHQMHLDTHHGGPKLMKHLLTKRFWILQCTRMVHTEFSQCIVCRKQRGESYKQQMGDLPEARVTLNRPFQFVGLDYAGPVEIKTSNLRSAKIQKGYIAVFVCMGTKAVHLELVSDQSTKMFLAAFHRFAARRGLPTEVFSDNGSNFEGANNQLNRYYYLEQNREIAKVVVNNKIKWNFIPPGAPNFGGLWERAVRSMKEHIKKTLKTARLTFEEYNTLLCQVEACMNSRPLCSTSDDIDNLEVLTPGHFLIGHELLAPPDENMSVKSANNRDRWKYVQWLQHQLWLRWTNEYLVELQQRHKWQASSDNAKPGDMVAVKDDDLAPRNWLVGRIEEVYTGQDDKVRVATIRVPARQVSHDKKQKEAPMQSKLIRRPIRKLCPLMVEEKEQEMINQHARQQQPKKKYNLRPRSVQILTLAICFFGLLVSTAAEKDSKCIQTTPFSNDAGIYFEDMGRASVTQSEWKIWIYFNLEKYNTDLKLMKESLNKLTQFCKGAETESRNPAGVQCTHTITLLKQQLEDINQMNMILQQNKQAKGNNRTKRAAPFNFVGWIGNKLFGIMDAVSAEAIEKQIASLKNDDNSQQKLIAEHTNIIELTKNLLKESQEASQQKFNILRDAILQLSNETDLSRKRDQINGWSLYMALILNTVEKTQHTMIDMLTDLQQGHVSSYLFTPQQFKQELEQINDILPNNCKLPVSPQHDMKSFYEIMRGRMRVTKDKILLEIILPLVSVDEFQIFHLIPVPVQYNNEQACIIPESQYLLITLKRDVFYQMNDKQLNECIQTHDIPIICPDMHPANSITSTKSVCERQLLTGSNKLDQCQIRIQSNNDVWIQLKTKNNWIFGLRNKTTLNIVKGSNVDTVTLQGNGIMSIQPGCEISYHGSTIIGQSQIRTTAIHNFIPRMNLSALIEENHPKVNVINFTSTNLDRFDNINKQFSEIKNTMETNHQWYGSIQIAVVLLMIGVLGILTMALKYKFQLQNWWRLQGAQTTAIVGVQNGGELSNTTEGTTPTIPFETETSPEIKVEQGVDDSDDKKAAHTAVSRHSPGGCPFRT